MIIDKIKNGIRLRILKWAVKSQRFDLGVRQVNDDDGIWINGEKVTKKGESTHIKVRF